jgi:multidrug efflux pump subunit AcrA (membrane-fusion protein)
MWRNRKFMVVAIIVGVMLVGTVATVALAQTSPTTPTGAKTLSARVAAILGIDQSKVDAAFAKAKTDIENEALDARLKAAVDSGRMSQAQADQYRSWWQSRPQGVPGPGMGGRMGRGGIGGMCWPGPAPRQVAPVAPVQ